MAESITITDNRNGETLEIPIVNGRVPALRMARSFFPASGSSILAYHVHGRLRARYLDGEAGIFATGAIPSSSWPRSSTPSGGVPPAAERRAPAHRSSSEVWRHDDHLPHRFIHENVRKRALDASTTTAHPDVVMCLVSAVAAPRTFARRQGHLRIPNPATSRSSAPIAKMPTLAAAAAHRFSAGMPSSPSPLPGNKFHWFRRYFLSMLWKVAEFPVRGGPDPGSGPSMSSSSFTPTMIELLDHGHARSSYSLHSDPSSPLPPTAPRCTDLGTAGPTRPSSAC